MLTNSDLLKPPAKPIKIIALSLNQLFIKRSSMTLTINFKSLINIGFLAF